MFPYKVPIAIVTTLALLRSPIVIAQDIGKVNQIARNISVKITGYSNGSGFILEREGNVYSVVTNKHVVPIEAEYEIQTYDGTQHQVTNRQEIPDLDLAIIQFASTEEYEVAELGNSNELEQRQIISVAGFPGEQTDLDIIDGQIRSIRQEIIANPEQKQGYALIYTNQTLPGSSGGAVLDEKGRVVAINGEGETDIKTGREISRGIPINMFLEAEEKMSASNNHSSRTITNNDINDINDWKLERTLNGHSDPVTDVAISINKIVSASADTIKIWNLKTGELERSLTGHSFTISSITINGSKIFSSAKDGTIKIWNLKTGELERTFTLDSNLIYSVAIIENKIIRGDYHSTIKIWNLQTGELERTITSRSGSIYSVVISGDKIVGGDENSTIKIWSVATGELERTLTGHSGSVFSVVISCDKIISGSYDNTIKIWNLGTGKLEQTLTAHSDSVNSVAVSGDIIVSGSSDNTIKVWQLQK